MINLFETFSSSFESTKMSSEQILLQKLCSKMSLLLDATFNIKRISYKLAELPIQNIKQKYIKNTSDILTNMDSVFYDLKRIETVLDQYSNLTIYGKNKINLNNQKYQNNQNNHDLLNKTINYNKKYDRPQKSIITHNKTYVKCKTQISNNQEEQRIKNKNNKNNSIKKQVKFDQYTNTNLQSNTNINLQSNCNKNIQSGTNNNQKLNSNKNIQSQITYPQKYVNHFPIVNDRQKGQKSFILKNSQQQINMNLNKSSSIKNMGHNLQTSRNNIESVCTMSRASSMKYLGANQTVNHFNKDSKLSFAKKQPLIQSLVDSHLSFSAYNHSDMPVQWQQIKNQSHLKDLQTQKFIKNIKNQRVNYIHHIKQKQRICLQMVRKIDNANRPKLGKENHKRQFIIENSNNNNFVTFRRSKTPSVEQGNNSQKNIKKEL